MRARRGASAVEAALSLPVLLALLAGTLDCGWYLHQRGLLSEAAQAGARAAGVTTDPADIPTVAEAAVDARLAAFGIDPDTATVSATLTSGAVDAVDVDVVLTHRALTGLTPLPGTLTARASATYEDPSGG